jgi:hypothetical protein
MRDFNYFDFAEKFIREHRRKDTRPLFVEIQTIFPHAPYDIAEVPEADLPASSFSADAKANEYVRRVSMARADLGKFLDYLKASPGDRGSVVAEFGDHQGEATRDFAFDLAGGPQAFADFHSIIYRTYFAIHAFGVTLDLGNIRPEEDIPYLAARLIEAAKLPTSPMFRDLIRLSNACSGRFHRCDKRAEIDLHLKKRQNAGMLTLD